MTVLKNFKDIDARITLEASEDMDDAYTAVKQGASNTDTCDLCDTAGEKAIGVIDRNYDDGEFASVIRSGIVPIRVGAAVVVGARLTTDGSGRAITMTDLHEWQLGIALNAGSAAGDEIAMLIVIAPRDVAAATGTGYRIVKTRVAAASSGFAAETDLFTLPAKCIVVDAWVDIITAEATGSSKLVDIGTSTVSNDPNGFVEGLSVAATGVIVPVAAFTTGSQITFFASSTYGALLAPVQVAGADDADDSGAYLEAKFDKTSVAAVVSASPAGADFAEFVGDIYVAFIELG
jgi:hypothetical protein